MDENISSVVSARAYTMEVVPINRSTSCSHLLVRAARRPDRNLSCRFNAPSYSANSCIGRIELSLALASAITCEKQEFCAHLRETVEHSSTA